MKPLNAQACSAKTHQTVVNHKQYQPPVVRDIDRYCERVHDHAGDHMFYYEGQERTFPTTLDEMRR